MPADSSSTESARQRRRIGGGPLVAVTLILLPVLYVLSSGPVAWLVCKGIVSGHTFDGVYAPLIRCSKIRPLWHAWSWYFGKWMPNEAEEEFDSGPATQP